MVIGHKLKDNEMNYCKQWRQAAREAMKLDLAWTHLDTFMVQYQKLVHSGVSEYDAIKMIQK